jgi:aminopeptidase YwaD
MATPDLKQTAQAYLHILCHDISNRRVGSVGNRAATNFFAETARSSGFTVEITGFDCMDWQTDGVQLTVGDVQFEAFASPYAPGCSVNAPLVVVDTVAALENAKLVDRIALLHGEIAAHQLMPKNFPFYNPDEHRHIIGLLEQKQPLAIIAATGRDVEMVGSVYPFPLFEDGDFDIPSVYMKDVDGERLLDHAGDIVRLHSRAQRIPARGTNVVTYKGHRRDKRVVIFAHIDAKKGTPGALDNAGGVVVLLLLAELLADYIGDLSVELVAMNGEDYYSTPGHRQYLMQNKGHFDTIQLGVNIDGIGYHKGAVAYSLYDCPANLSPVIEEVMTVADEIVAGDPWYQGDHGIFLMQGVSALAFTSQHLDEIMTDIIHTEKDTPEIVDAGKLVSLAQALNTLIRRLDESFT